MKNLHKKYIKDPVFGFNFWFLLGNREKAKAFIKRKSGYEFELNDFADGCLCNENNVVFLWLSKKNLSVLIHELMHLVAKAMLQRGIKLCDETEETYAYYYEFAFNECFHFMKKI